jgi:chemosensory pili system protein ChpA (sensor histidine kinase/response regulator)
MQKRQPSRPAEDSLEADASQANEIDSVLSAVVTAALDDIQKTKSAILEFIKDSSNTDNIDLCVALMDESRGALELLDQPRAVEVIEGLLAYLKGYDIVEFMETSRLDALSQVVVSLEYYLEALGEHRKDAEHILDLADTQLKELLANVRIKQEGEETQMLELVTDDDEAEREAVSARGEPAPEAVDDGASGAAPSAATGHRESAAAESDTQGEADETPAIAATQTMAIPTALDTSVMEIEEIRALRDQQPQVPTAPTPPLEAMKPKPPVPPPVPPEEMLKVTPVEDDLEVLKSGSDDDILEIYLEEAQEEAQNIARLQKDWLLHPEDENALKNIRRAFHTIKGSGRLVGAMKIGEFAWDYEQLLNRVIDKTIPPDHKVIEAVGKAAKVLPELVHELKTGEPPRGRVAYLRGLARALAEFRADQLLVEHTQLMKPVRLPDDPAGTGDADWKDPVTDASTKVVPRQLIDEPDTMRFDSAALAAGTDGEEITFDETEQLPTEVIEVPEDLRDEAEFSFDETEQLPLKEIPRPDPGVEIEPIEFTETELAFTEAATQYTQAIDYARERATETAESSTAPAPEALAAAEPEAEQDLPDEIGFESADEIGAWPVGEPDALPRAEITIETIGDDFVGEGGPDDTRSSMDYDVTGVYQAAADPADASDAGEQDSTATGEVEVQAQAPEPEEIVMESEVFESEEIVMESEAPEFDEIVMESEVSESDQIVKEPEAPEPDANVEQPDEAEFGGMALEATFDDVAAESRSADDDSAREIPHDPFVETTTARMPGTEAGDSEPETRAAGEPTGLSFDPELLIIYQQEVEQHLDTVSSALDRAEKTGELIPGEELYRALHTIHGASRTADISSIGKLADLMEKPLKSAIAQKLALDLEIVALYREGQHAIQSLTSELVETRRLPSIPTDLQTSFEALAEDFEEHTVEIPEDGSGETGSFVDTLSMMNEAAESEQDDELLTIFIDEANELLEMSDNTLHEWGRQSSDDKATQDFGAVMELQRYLHTLKGGARMAELAEISDLSHELESMFIAVIDGRVEKNENLLELLKDSFDLLHRQVTEAQEGGPMSDSSEMVRALRDLRLEEGEQAVEEMVGDSTIVDSEAINIVSENLPEEPLTGIERQSQDVIKVRSDLLDNLVNAAGEASIYRARMEQQVAGLGSYLGELGQTIARLKTQLRSLEAQTEAQIHYSHRTESGRSDFDPLEMDRYTMIQELSRSLGESVNDLSSLQTMLGDQVKDSETLLLQQSRVNTDLQDGLIKSRMVRFSGLLSRLRRLVRQSSQELGKKAELLVTGENNEVDNKVLDRMVAPLEHIIRNALSHGIETPVERVKKGKPESGRIAIDITRDGSEVVIRVSDDGAGVNLGKVRSRAIQLGLLDRSQPVSDADLVQYILEPGFSTAEHVTQLSGRGVGMDVVDIEVKQLGGTLQIETNPQGTTFVARLPFTLSINQAILVRCDDETYAIPLLNIEGITRLDASAMLEYYSQETPELEYGGQNFAVHRLADLVGLDQPFRPGPDEAKQPVILGRAGDVRVALHVDEVLGNREIVVKSLGKQLSQVRGLAGASILADGSVVLILDIAGLVRQSAARAVKIVYQAETVARPSARSTVMVVDDSITMRRVASKLLERHNYKVVTARDGVDALAQLQDVLPDVMLLDIEMPRMDGFELASHMRNEESYSRIPIIMITSRTGEKHRDRALEIGVANYMGKPYQEDELIENIQSALGG